MVLPVLRSLGYEYEMFLLSENCYVLLKIFSFFVQSYLNSSWPSAKHIYFLILYCFIEQ